MKPKGVKAHEFRTSSAITQMSPGTVWIPHITCVPDVGSVFYWCMHVGVVQREVVKYAVYIKSYVNFAPPRGASIETVKFPNDFLCGLIVDFETNEASKT